MPTDPPLQPGRNPNRFDPRNLARSVIAIPLLLLYDDDLFGLVDCSVLGTILINVAAVLTVVSMLYYLRKALPYASVRG